MDDERVEAQTGATARETCQQDFKTNYSNFKIRNCSYKPNVLVKLEIVLHAPIQPVELMCCSVHYVSSANICPLWRD